MGGPMSGAGGFGSGLGGGGLDGLEGNGIFDEGGAGGGLEDDILKRLQNLWE